MISYLGLPGSDRGTDPSLMYATAFSCPTALRYPGTPYWAFLRTYSISDHMSGGCQHAPEHFEGVMRVRGYPRVMSMVSHPSDAFFFFDSPSFRVYSWSGRPDPYYNPYNRHSSFPSSMRHAAFFIHGMVQTPYEHGGAGWQGSWATTTPDAMSPDDRINVVFADGHVEGVTRAETEEAAESWETHPFFPGGR